MTAPLVPAGERKLNLLALAPEVCAPNELRREDGRELACRLSDGVHYARLIECRRGDTGDLVVFEVEVETPQRTTHDIRPQERLAAWFEAAPPPPARSAAQETFALREDFPPDIPHINLREYDYPRSLCLSDVPFDELRAMWTPARYVRLVREWLRLTAIGELHAHDQPVEPLMLGGFGSVILPNLLRTQDAVLGLRPCGERNGMPVWLAVPQNELLEQDKRLFVACVRAQPRTHGVIRRAPTTIAELHDLLAPDDDVRGKLVAILRDWKERGIPTEARIAIALLVPMKRSADAPPEIEQPWIFLTLQTIADAGIALGLWVKGPAGLGALLPPGAGDGGVSIQLLPAFAYFDHRREDAALFNGRASPDERRFVAVGAGALGSQILEALARAAFGRWIVVDEDVLLPHNLARHVLPRSALGFEKARAVVHGVMNNLAADGDVHEYLVADILNPGEKADAVVSAIREAEVIVDMSASVAVARALARDFDAPGRRVSLFLNPTGTDIVLLAEASDRVIPIDAVEMQYYRAIRNQPSLAGTLRHTVARERYGRSCRDVSSRLPHARIAALAGIGAQALQQAVDESRAIIRCWRQDERALGITATDIHVEPVVEQQIDGWRIVTDKGLLARLRELREAKLPNETGGVLLGHVDVSRLIVYIVDTIPSPPDSQEWPTLYIRGAAGLREAVEEAQVTTAGQLHYTGEWHSHPRGIPPLPSADDLQVFAWITEALDADGLPAVMGIVGEGGMALFVGSIDPRRGPTLVVPENPPRTEE